MALENTRLLKENVLRRAGESTSGTDYGDDVIVYLNNTYHALAAGASEFAPEFVEDWWWLRSSGVLTLEPTIETGTVSVTKGSTSVTFSSAPAESVEGWRFKVEGHPDVFKIASHTGGAGGATLDSEYTGETDGSASFRLMKVEYDLSDDVQALISPIIAYRSINLRPDYQIHGVSPERMDELYPLARLLPGAPEYFALEDEGTVRFSHGGRSDGTPMRVEYRYRRHVPELTDDASSEPLIPKQWRSVLSDMALYYILIDKNDDRAQAIGGVARNKVSAMLKENRRRLAKIDGSSGKIFPRQGTRNLHRRTLRTESGLIIG